MTRRLIALLLPFLFLALVAGCARSEPAEGCRSDSQCAANARCVATVCTANSSPTASIGTIGPVEAFALVQLDGSPSSDPDGDLAEYVWSTSPVDAPCAAPEVAGRGALAHVRFGCAGRFVVGLTVRDALGVESPPSSQEVVVSPSSKASTLFAGDDLSIDHTCSGSPLVCRTAAPVQLAASAAQGLAVRWTVEPPRDRPLDGSRRLAFSPDASVAAPLVEVSSGGAAIAGDWVFRVEARDAYGVVGTAHMRVTIRNRAPIVSVNAAGPFPHAFDAARSAFVSSGTVAWSAFDPDGDPVEVSGLWRHVGDAGSSFDGELSGTAVTFAVVVPYAAPEDALRLRGAPDLSRLIELVATDPNGAVGRGQSEIAIDNRPPLPSGGTFDSSVAHRFDPARRAYVAALQAGTYADPDGDPLFGMTAGTGPCTTTRVEGSHAIVECEAAYEGAPDVLRLAGRRTYVVALRDPWEPLAAQPARSVEILDAPPTMIAVPNPASLCVTADFWGRVWRIPDASFEVRPSITDPDGDPVLVRPSVLLGCCTASPASGVCEGGVCPVFQFLEPSPGWTPATVTRSFLTASDGAGEVTVGVSPALLVAPAARPCP